jgi:hypothetical protein
LGLISLTVDFAVRWTHSTRPSRRRIDTPGAVCRRQAMRPGLMIGAWCVSSAAAFSVPTSSLFTPASSTLRRPLPLSSRRLASSGRAGGEMLARGTATGHSTTIRGQASRHFHRSHASHGRVRSGSAAVLLGGIGAASLFSLWGSAGETRPSPVRPFTRYWVVVAFCPRLCLRELFHPFYVRH